MECHGHDQLWFKGRELPPLLSGPECAFRIALAVMLRRGSEIPINPNVEKWGMGASWDRVAGGVDVDLQAGQCT